MKIEEYLKKNGVAFTEHEHPPAYTAQEVAAEEHVSGDIMAKAVVVRADKEFVMCVLPASYKLDMEKVGTQQGASHVRLADENELAKLFPDVEVGAEPPFGSLYGLPTLVDGHLTVEKDIVFQAGTHHKTLRIAYEDYARLANPTKADLAVHL